MTPDKKPALTAQEWADAFDPEIHTDALLYEVSYLWGSARPHGVAALCLHGQPFGFTREDVELVRGLRGRPSEYDSSPIEDDDPALDALADRIEALLPPEAP